MSNPDDTAAVQKVGEARDAIVKELRKSVVGMDDVIDEMMIAIFAQGHVLLVGVPGLAKTLLVSALAKTLSLSFKRIQFTPDLMPSDITGTELLQEDPETHERKFKFLLEGLSYGAPPHGGIALGLDRMMMLLLGVDTISDVIAFPKTKQGTCLLTDAPATVDDDQLDELGIQLIEQEE